MKGTKALDAWAQSVAEARRKVAELPAEDREFGVRLNRRYWALDAAIRELVGEEHMASEGYRQMTIDALKELKEELGMDFRTFREERGIPEL